MDTQWIIRTAKTEDAEGLRVCMALAYKAYEPRMAGRHLPPMEADYAAEIRDAPVWVIDLNGVIAGGLIMDFSDNYASISNIAVHPEFQGQRMGGALMKFASMTAKEQGFTELHLATHVLLTENIALYRHLGWKESDRDETRVYMQKTL